MLLAALAFAALAAPVAYLSYAYWTRPAQPLELPSPGAGAESRSDAAGSIEASPSPSPDSAASPIASPAPDFSPLAGASPPASHTSPPAEPPVAAYSSGSRLVMPVAGVRPEQLSDTFTQSRSEGRTHNAIDIIAPRGTPVRAAVDGPIVKLFRSERGGITLYQRGPDGRTIYYYAHLDGYADGMTEGRQLRRGETIGFVGDTGNTQPGNCHLHFQIYVPTDDKNIWDGTPVNPYPLLLSAEP
jgi:murein DD-endopeptidase MepM/ murein hydrolase activator NlpD